MREVQENAERKELEEARIQNLEREGMLRKENKKIENERELKQKEIELNCVLEKLQIRARN